MNFTANGLLQYILYFGVILLLTKPLGLYMAKVYQGQTTLMEKGLGWLERLLYKAAGIDSKSEMNWQQYAVAVIMFSIGGFILLYGILRLQGVLPMNPQNFSGVSPDLAFNTAVSFLTNTNWQSYGGESTMSYFSQMAGLVVQNFISAAVGMAILVALIRGFVRKKTSFIGNFWVDMIRTNLYVLLPLSLILAILLGSQGVVQTFSPNVAVPLIEKSIVEEKKDDKGIIIQKADVITDQSIAVGPVASQIAIKQLGTNGGGFFNVNSAHPFENPTPFSNFLEMISILLIPAALCYTFGVMVGDRRQGWAIWIAMAVILLPLTLICIGIEQHGNPLFANLGIDQSLGNMEGKEMRFGSANSAIWATVTTAASNGSVNSMHDSFTPLGGMIPLIMLQFSEVVFGGVGSGLYGMLAYVLITVFIAGLMVGRTPEYLGKKIQSFEIKMVSIAILITPFLALLGTAIAVMLEAGKTGIFNPGAQGFSEILYAFTSASDNNGSAFAGLNANTPFYNSALGIVMLLGRFWIIIPILAIAGSFAEKNSVPQSAGTLPTHTPLFIAMLVSIVVMVGLLTYVPALALGPVAEHFNLLK